MIMDAVMVQDVDAKPIAGTATNAVSDSILKTVMDTVQAVTVLVMAITVVMVVVFI